jgi:hypothetical protein
MRPVLFPWAQYHSHYSGALNINLANQFYSYSKNVAIAISSSIYEKLDGVGSVGGIVGKIAPLAMCLPLKYIVYLQVPP